MELVEFFGHSLIVFGTILCAVGALGLIRLPDVFSRMHGAGVIDTLGIGATFLGLIVLFGFNLISAKLIMILIFIFFSGPTASHALARAALNGGAAPKVNNDDIKPPVDVPGR